MKSISGMVSGAILLKTITVSSIVQAEFVVCSEATIQTVWSNSFVSGDMLFIPFWML